MPRAKWDVLAEKSLFALPEFAACWHSRNLRPIFFALEDNVHILAGMAGVVSGGRLVPRFESMIDGLDGGVVTADNDATAAARLYEDILGYFRRHRFFRASIHNPQSTIALPDFKQSTRLTHIIDIENPDAKRDPKVDEHVRAGRRRGTQIAAFDDSPGLGRFHDLVMQTANRHGTKPRYAPAVFERMYELSKKDSRIIWIAAVHEGKLIASRISFVTPSRIINWQSFSDKDSARLKANHLMMEEIIERARGMGIREIDLGGSPAEAEGLIDFKKRWGGRETALASYTYCSNLGSLYYRWKNR